MGSKVETIERAQQEPVAIIGMGCRFPGGANSPAEFWRLLREGEDAIREVPSSRWEVEEYYAAEAGAAGKMSSRWGGFIEGVEGFDAEFYGISPREAASMDPQQRVVMEVAWEALEDAGQVIDRLAGSQTGVFVGIYNNDYRLLQLSDASSIDAYSGTGTTHCIAANRISYLLDLRGPSLAVDTSCSSSLVAVHLACQSLRSGESNLALACGVNLILSPVSSILASKLVAMAADGRCKTFDACADGIVRGEGCGVVVLKRLSGALADGDNIIALILGSAVNQDGLSNGLTAPNLTSQQQVITQALKHAGIEPCQVSYVEAHGTGTTLGDPIEMEALTSVLNQGRSKDQGCAIGSVKTNIGHLEAAAGIAGLIKAALSLKHQTIVPHLHLRSLNPNIDLRDTPFVIPAELRPWLSDSGRRYAGVSAFSIGGTNAHVILSDVDEPEASDQHQQDATTGDPCLLPISARSGDALRSQAQAFRDYLNDTGAQLKDVCYTAGARRAHHHHRLAVAGHSKKDLSTRLDAFLRGEARPGLSSGKASSARQGLAFVFSGQGSQWVGMGRELLTHSQIFRDTLKQCDEIFRQYAEWSLLDELKADELRSRLDSTEVAQPAIFAIQASLLAVWRSWGITPDAVTGHSLGEITAAYAAGVIALEDAIRIVFHRSRLMNQAAGLGKMAAVEMSLKDAQEAVAVYDGKVSIAAINGPASITLSGDSDALRDLIDHLQCSDLSCSWLRVNCAFHSPQMKAFYDQLIEPLRGVQTRPASIPIVSTVTGKLIDGCDLDAEYWGRNLIDTVRFADAVETLIKEGHRNFLEISPHPVLLKDISECLRDQGEAGVALASLRRHKEERAVMLAALGALYTSGHPVNWSYLYPAGGRVVQLPSYCWQRKRHWIKASESGVRDSLIRSHRIESSSPAHPLLGERLRTGLPVFEARLRADSLPYLKQHLIDGQVVLPGACYVESVLKAATDALGNDYPVLEDVIIHRPIVLSEESDRIIQLILVPDGTGGASFQFLSQDEDEPRTQSWALHAEGRISAVRSNMNRAAQFDFDLAELQSRLREKISADDFYRDLRALKIDCGPSFRGVRQLWRQQGEALAEVQLPGSLAPGAASYRMHPALLDSCLQVVGAALAGNEDGEAEQLHLLTAIESLVSFAALPQRLWSHAVVRSDDRFGKLAFTSDIRVFD
ncbi:MAG TPA: beta-ketoacyl synthase N-terminal-like domain-containing protein, partial [Blastocatellia bacterium]